MHTNGNAVVAVADVMKHTIERVANFIFSARRKLFYSLIFFLLYEFYG